MTYQIVSEIATTCTVLSSQLTLIEDILYQRREEVDNIQDTLLQPNYTNAPDVISAHEAKIMAA